MKKRFKPLAQKALLTLMDDESLPIIGIKDTGFVVKAPIEKLSYYYNYDKKVEALLRVYGQSFYLCLSLSKISSEPIHLEDLANHCRLSVHEIIEYITTLSLNDRVRLSSGHMVSKHEF